MSPAPQLVVLFLGDNQWPEFQSAWQLLERETQVAAVPDVATARQLLSTLQPVPELIVVAQAWPGQFPTIELQSLRQAAPLAKMIGLLGSWCEGERRTGLPWPDVPRIYWHGWDDAFRNNLACWQSGLPPSWSCPDTALDEERLLAAASSARSGPAQPCELAGPVAIDTRHADLADFLYDACRAEGWSALVVRHQRACASGSFRGLGAVLWDAAGRGPAAGADLAAIVQAVSPSPVLVLCDFPRWDQVRQFQQAGAAGFFSKPLCWENVVARLRAIAARPKHARAPVAE